MVGSLDRRRIRVISPFTKLEKTWGGGGGGGGGGGEKKNSASMKMYLSVCSVTAGPRCQTG